MFNSNLSVFELELIHWLNNVFCVSLLDLDFYSDLCFDQHYLFQGFKSMILIYCQFLLIEIGFFLFEGNNSNFLLSSMICFWLAYSINIIKNLDSSLWFFFTYNFNEFYWAKAISCNQFNSYFNSSIFYYLLLKT